MRRHAKTVLWHVLRVAVAVGLVAFVVSRANLRDAVRPAPGEEARPIVGETDDAFLVRTEAGAERAVPKRDLETGRAVRIEGLASMARRLGPRWGWAVLALGFMLLQSPVGAVRWRALLRVQGVRISMLESLRLTYIGWFFNNWMPGATGGDLVKAYYIARQTHRKAEAVTVVFLDRFIGLISLAVLGAAAVLVSLGDPRLRLPQAIIAVFLGAVAVGTAVFYSRRLRRLLGLGRLTGEGRIARIAARVNEALFLYRYHKRQVLWAVVLAWVTQAASVTAAWAVATALGSLAAWHTFLVNMPVVWIGWSLVPVPGGFGVAEGLAQELFGPAVLGGEAGAMAVSEAATLALAMMLGYRLVQNVVSLPGAVFYLLRRAGVSASEMAAEMEAAEDEPPPAAADDAGAPAEGSPAADPDPTPAARNADLAADTAEGDRHA